MKEILLSLTPADYQFLVGLIESPLNLTDNGTLRGRLDAVLASDTPGTRNAIAESIEREIRYLGSADLAYLLRYVTGRDPGVPIDEVVRDVARTIHVRLPRGLTLSEQLRELVLTFVSEEFAKLPRERQQATLESLGVEKDKAAAFLTRSAGIFAVPVLIQTFGYLVVNGLIKNVVFAAIARLIGKRLSAQLFEIVMARFPWWLRWVGPVAWSASFGWIALDLQGPAMRKTIPVMLYLGLCVYRDEASVEAA